MYLIIYYNIGIYQCYIFNEIITNYSFSYTLLHTLKL